MYIRGSTPTYNFQYASQSQIFELNDLTNAHSLTLINDLINALIPNRRPSIQLIKCLLLQGRVSDVFEHLCKCLLSYHCRSISVMHMV